MAVTLLDILGTGMENAKKGKDIAKILGCSMRDVAAFVEDARRHGVPICANSGDPSGYYIAKTASELNSYIERLHHRENELATTRKSLIKIQKKNFKTW